MIQGRFRCRKKEFEVHQPMKSGLRGPSFAAHFPAW